jgi:hypothetical protein
MSERRSEQLDLSFCAPLGPLAQVELVRLEGQAAVAGEKLGQCLLLLGCEQARPE